MPPVVLLDCATMDKKIHAFCDCIERERTAKNGHVKIADDFRASVQGMESALDVLLETLNKPRKFDIVDLLNTENNHWRADAATLAFGPDEHVRERFREACSGHYGRAPVFEQPKWEGRKSAAKTEVHRTVNKVLSDFIEACTLYHVITNNAMGRLYEQPATSMETADRFIAVMQKYIVGGEGNIVTLSFGKSAP